MAPQTVKVTKTRDFRAHALIWHTSGWLLDAGQEKEQGSFHQFLASLVFTAFALEAYLNWLGEQLFPHWKYLDKLSPLERLQLVSDHLETELSHGSRPFQTVKALFKFRNSVAHAKPELLKEETLEVDDEHLDMNLGKFIRSEWEQYCNATNAERSREDVKNIINRLHEAANLDDELGPLLFGFQSHRAG
jgi:hypothetical protein